MKSLLCTEWDFTPVVLRIAMAVVFFPHGAQQVLGWFGGNGYSATMAFYTQQLGIPGIFAFLAIVALFFGSIGVFIGFLTRIAAFGIGATMFVAILMAHIPNGFFMNWYGNKHGEGFEFHLLAIGMAIALVIRGGGAYSVDREISKA